MIFNYKCPKCGNTKEVKHDEEEVFNPSDRTIAEITCHCEGGEEGLLMEVQIWEGVENYGKCNMYARFASSSIEEKRASLAKRSKEHDKKVTSKYRQDVLNNLQKGNWENPYS